MVLRMMVRRYSKVVRLKNAMGVPFLNQPIMHTGTIMHTRALWPIGEANEAPVRRKAIGAPAAADHGAWSPRRRVRESGPRHDLDEGARRARSRRHRARRFRPQADHESPRLSLRDVSAGRLSALHRARGPWTG